MTGPSLTSVDLHVRAEPRSRPARRERAALRTRWSTSGSATGAGRRGVPRRPAALARVAVQRELADHQQGRAELGGGPLAVEDPQLVDLGGQPGRAASVSSWVTPTRTHSPGAGGGPRPRRRPDAGLADPLHHGSHGPCCHPARRPGRRRLSPAEQPFSSSFGSTAARRRGRRRPAAVARRRRCRTRDWTARAAASPCRRGRA